MAKFYLSSTYEDLKECREEVSKTLQQMGHEVIGMEKYTADGRAPLKMCLADVASCDAYIGIFAWCYGYIPKKDNPQKKAITELEYCEALRLKNEILIFILDEKAEWPGEHYDEESRRIRALRKKLATAHTVKFFHDRKDLATQVSVAVASHFSGPGPVVNPPPPPPPIPPPWPWKWYALAALALVAFVFLAYQIKIRYWRGKTPPPTPGEYPTKRNYDFYLSENGKLQESWDFPQGQWSLEKGEGEDENDAALLIKGNQMGTPNDLSGKVFYNYRAQFKVRFKEGDKVAWVLRAQRDTKSGYLFELRKEGSTLFINGWVFRNNEIGVPLAGDGVLSRFSKCCNPTDAIHVIVDVVGYRFNYCFKVDSDFGHRTEDTGRKDTAEFQDTDSIFEWGSIGLLTTDGITQHDTNTASLMKVEYVYLTPLPRNQGAMDSTNDRSPLCDF